VFAQLVFHMSCDTCSFVYNSLYTGRNLIAFNIRDLEKTVPVMATKAVTALVLLCFLQVSYILVSEYKSPHSLIMLVSYVTRSTCSYMKFTLVCSYVTQSDSYQQSSTS
jgi:hypothetical protein